MKKYALFAAAALVALAACSKNEVKPQTPETPVDDDSPVAVQFGVASPVSSVVTKSYGPLDGWNEQESLYIYSFAREAGAIDYSTATPFINNVAATAPATGTTALSVTNPAHHGEPFYYADNDIYDFYGYFVDEAWASGTNIEDYNKVDGPVPPITNDPTRIYVPFVIDGTQDLMIAKADPQTDLNNAKDEPGYNQDLDDPNTENYVYSAYTARRGVQPTLTFEHQLARFNFVIKSKSESANKLKVTGIKVKSKFRGELTVVANSDDSRGITAISDATIDFELKQITDGKTTDLTPVSVENYTGTETAPQSVGCGIMVIPGEASYDLVIELAYDEDEYSPDQLPNTPINPIESTIDASTISGRGEGNTTETFLKGEQYTITVYIIGPQEVEISAELDDWTDGGNVEIDPDDKPELPSAGQGN
ncbi:MAG: fimbrillin family protein [Bacteroidetes bacterium]|uniref:Fimbrillin family protein n=1 Tax=Candidatus Cryptobacteroides faecavium TaxID=2840762 RepID=A0A9D9NER5_9BACT|nr:fimbrillin family protein [Candidatus Cryptobacteroides faecavium]